MHTPARHHRVIQRAAVALLMLGVALTASPLLAAGRSAAPGGTLLPALATGPPYWLPVASMHTRRHALAATLGPDGRLYALGGSSFLPNALATGEAYDATANTWTPIARMRMPRYSFGLVTGQGGCLFALGGTTGKQNVGSVEAYLPATGRWVEMATTGAPPPGLIAIAGLAGTIYTLEDSTGIQRYTPTTKTWTQVTTLLTRRSEFAAVLGPNKRLYIMGGQPDASPIYSPVPLVEAYDLQTRGWTRLAPLLTPRSDGAAVSAPDGRLYAVGGWQTEFEATAAVEAYDLRTRRWSAVASLHARRTYLQAVRGPDGRLYALGGLNDNGAGVRGAIAPTSAYLATVEAYGPLLHLTPSSVPVGGTAALTGTNFAASATVTVTWGSAPGGTVLATGQTDRAGTLPYPLRFPIPAGTRPGHYVVTAIDNRSRYPVTAPLTVGVPASTSPRPTLADPVRAACCGGRFFPQTGHSLSGPFLAYYQKYGGLDTFGYPRTEPFTDTGHVEQYTDRFLLEQTSSGVRPAPLGRLLTQGRAFPPLAAFPSTPTRQYVPATGHSLSGAFLAYWRAHHGATLLGAPIAEPTHEQNGDGSRRTYLVQWCENGRLEMHPEQTDTRYQVQLGLVGKQALRQRGWLP